MAELEALLEAARDVAQRWQQEIPRATLTSWRRLGLVGLEDVFLRCSTMGELAQELRLDFGPYRQGCTITCLAVMRARLVDCGLLGLPTKKRQ